MTTEIKKIDCEIKTAKFSGLGEVPVLFYGDAKKNGIKEGDVFEVNSPVGGVFEVGSYKSHDQSGRKISSFILNEKI